MPWRFDLLPGLIYLDESGGGGGGGTCANSPQLLCLGGRAGTTNDPRLTLAGIGTLYGSVAGATMTGPYGLALNVNDNATLGPLGLIQLNQNTTTWQGTNFLLVYGATNGTVTLNDDATFGPALLGGFLFTGDFEVGDDSQGGSSGVVFSFSPTVHNPTGVSKILGQAWHTFESSPTFVADSALASITDDQIGMFSHANYTTQGGGTLSLAFPFAVSFSSRDVISPDGVSFAGDHIGYRYLGLVSAGGPITTSTLAGNDTGLEIHDGDLIASGRMMSVQSQGPLRQLSHAGPAVFGADAAPTGAYMVEVIGDAHITGKLTVDGLIDPPQVVIDNDVAQPPLVIQHAVNVPNLDADLLDGQHAAAFATAADLTTLTTAVAGKAPLARSVATTGPLAGGGDLSADRTLSIAKATGSVDGYLAATDFAAFTAKAGLTDTKTLSAQSAAAGPTNFANTATSGLYAIFYTLRCSTVDALAVGIVTVTFAWNDGTGARTVVSGNVAVTALTAIASGVVGLIRLGSGNITYQTAITASLGTGKYDLDATLVRVG